MAILVVAFYSCSKDDLKDTNNENLVSTATVSSNLVTISDSELIVKFKDVGLVHNINLDSVYNSLSRLLSDTINHPITNNQVDSVFIYSPVRNIDNYYSQFSVSDTGIIYNFLRDDIYEIIGQEITTGNDSLLLQSISLSDSCLSIIADVENAVLVSPTSTVLNPILDSILYGRISHVSSLEEKESIIAGINVAKASFKYWKQNLDKWVSLFPQTNSKVAIDGRELAASDLHGAIVGAYNGARIGGVATAAGGGIGGAIAGGVLGGATGAIGGSALYAISKIAGLPGWLNNLLFG